MKYLLTEEIEGIEGLVSLMFYIPETVDGYKELREQVEDHGGACVKYHNSKIIQI